MAGAATVSIQEAAKFEKATVTVMSVIAETGAQADITREKLMAAAKTLGTDFGIGATGAMQALEALMKAGQTSSEAVDSLAGSLTLAKLESIDTRTASNYLVQALTMFGIEAKNASDVINAMSKASDAGIGSASNYAQGLSNVGATANNMGFSIEETLAALVQLDNTFGDAASSGTFMNRMLLDLGKKSETAGIELYTADGAMRSLDDIVGQISAKIDSFGDSQKDVNEWVGQFDTRAQRAILALSGYDQSIIETMTSMDGMRTATEKVDMIMETFSGKMSVLTARMNEARIELGTALMPTALDFMGWLTDVTPAISRIVKQFTTWTVGIGDAAKALLEGDWDSAYQALEKVYSNISTKFMEWFNAIRWGDIFTNLRTFMGTLWESMKTWTGDIGSYFTDWWDEIDWGSVWGKFSSYASNLFDIIKDEAGDIVAFFMTWFDSIDWGGMFTGLQAYASTLFPMIVEKAGDIVAFFTEWFGQVEWSIIWSNLQTYASNLWENVKTWAGGIHEAFVKWWEGVGWNDVWSKLTDFAKGLWPHIITVAGGIHEAFVKWWEGIGWDNVWSKLTDFAEGLWPHIVTAAGGIHAAFVAWWEEISWDTVWSELTDFAKALWPHINTAAKDIHAAFVAWWKEIKWDTVWSELTTYAEGLWPLINDLADDINDAFVAWWKEIKWNEVWQELEDFMKPFFETIFGWAGTIATEFLNWFGEITWLEVYDELNTFMEGFFEWIFGTAGTPETAFKTWIESVNWFKVFASLATFAISLPFWILEQIKTAQKHVMQLLADYIVDGITHVATAMGKVATTIIDAVEGAVKGAIDTVKNWLPDWVKKILGLMSWSPKITWPSIPNYITKAIENLKDLTKKDKTSTYTTPEGDVRNKTTTTPTPKPPPSSYDDFDDYYGRNQYGKGGHFYTRGPSSQARSIVVHGQEEVAIAPKRNGGVEGMFGSSGGAGGGINVNVILPNLFEIPRDPAVIRRFASVIQKELMRQVQY